MARNEFGVICDRCGKMSHYKNEFYRLILPTFYNRMNNSVFTQDYCFNCYFELKKQLKEFYKIDW